MRYRGILALLGVLVLAACGAPQPESVNGVRIIRASESNAILSNHVDAVNAFRASRGLGPVTLSSRLSAAAATHARDMSVQERAWHFGSDGTSPDDRGVRAGYPGRVLGENISESYDDDVRVIQSWIDDPITRRVMLRPDADNVGLGWFQEPDGKLWWVQMVGRSGTGLASAETGFRPG